MIRPKLIVIEHYDLIDPELERALRDEFDLLSVSDRTTALTLVKEHSPSVILLDLDFPVGTFTTEENSQFLQDICKNGFRYKVIVCSSNVDRQTAVRAIGLGGWPRDGISSTQCAVQGLADERDLAPVC